MNTKSFPDYTLLVHNTNSQHAGILAEFPFLDFEDYGKNHVSYSVTSASTCRHVTGFFCWKGSFGDPLWASQCHQRRYNHWHPWYLPRSVCSKEKTGWPFVGNEGSFIHIITMYLVSFPHSLLRATQKRDCLTILLVTLFGIVTLPKTNIFAEKMGCYGNDPASFWGNPIFRCYVKWPEIKGCWWPPTEKNQIRITLNHLVGWEFQWPK